MKKIYLIIIIIMLSVCVNAQITLTSSTSTPIIGSIFTYIGAGSSTTLNVTHSGANQIWDFSTVTGLSRYYSFDNLANSVDPSSFPSANLVGNFEGYEDYYNNSSSTYAIIGKRETVITREIYPDKIEVLNFPITYLDVFNETFSGTKEILSSGTTYNRSGTLTIEADGYGALILPYAIVSNVLKVTSVANYTDTLGSTFYQSYLDTVITFYNAFTNNYIASYKLRYWGGNFISRKSEYIVQSELVIGIEDVITNKNDVIIFPNPINNTLTIESNSVLSKIKILDVAGQLIKEITSSFNLSLEIDVSDLKSGIYFVSYVSESGKNVKKVIIE